MKKLYYLLIILLSLFFVPSRVFAGGFAITSIGEMDLQGTAYPQYWYTGNNVLISGTGPASAVVALSIDGTSNSLTTDAGGNWSHTANLTEGDHQVSLSATSVSPYTFTLTIGEPPSEVGSISAPTTPSAGVGYPMIVMFTLGIMLFSFSIVIFRQKLGTSK